jgi:fatty acid desaturase
MFLHVEHHMFPKVPTKNLWRLAARIDRQNPAIKQQKVF